MKNLIKTKFVEIWIDETAPIIYSKVLKAPETTELYKVLNENQLGIIKEMAKHNYVVFSICDASGLQLYSFDLLVSYFSEILPRLIEAGLTFKVIVCPKNIISPISLVEVTRGIGSLSIGIFDSLKEGYNYINSELLKFEKTKISGETVEYKLP